MKETAVCRRGGLWSARHVGQVGNGFLYTINSVDFHFNQQRLHN